MTLEDQVQQAQQGDAEALEQVIAEIANPVFNLALRMLGQVPEAEDAAQEILIKVITSLGAFEGRSRFTTWVHTVAANHVRDLLRRNKAATHYSLEDCAQWIDQRAAAAWDSAGSAPMQNLVIEEMRQSCLLGLLQGLDQDQRLAYVLGEVFELDGLQGAAICGCSPAAFRKRLSRARDQLRAFVTKHCDAVREDAPCSCARLAQYHVQRGRLNPQRLTLADRRQTRKTTSASTPEVTDLDARAKALLDSLPEYVAPAALGPRIRLLLDARGWVRGTPDTGPNTRGDTK